MFSMVALVVPPTKAASITATRSFLSPVDDGYMSVWANGDYPSAQTSFYGDLHVSDNGMIGGQYGIMGYNIFQIYRSYVYFDTSDIPDGAHIDSAILELYCTGDLSTYDFDVVIQGTATYPHIPLQTSDFYYGWYGSTSLGSRNTGDGLSSSAFWNITLNAAGLGLIATTGTSRFCLRSGYDISATEPTDNEFINIATREDGEAYAPRLIVTYTVGTPDPTPTPTPTVTPTPDPNASATPTPPPPTPPPTSGTHLYSYYIKGPYTDQGDVYNGTVSCKLFPTAASTIFFQLVGSAGVADEQDYTLEQAPVSLTWNISDSGNYSRTHYFTDDKVETIYVIVPQDGSPFYLYTFSINDFVGIHNGYLESMIYLDGAYRIVERQPIQTVNSVPFYMVWGFKYDLRLICDEGTLPFGAFTALSENSASLIIPFGAFDSGFVGNLVGLSAVRYNSTMITIAYNDPNSTTVSLAVSIYHYEDAVAVVDYNESVTGPQIYTLSWNLADPSTDYVVSVIANVMGDLKAWAVPCPNFIKADIMVNPWAFLSALGSGLPFDLQYLPAILIVVACMLGFSFWHISVGAWSSWIAAAFLFMLGWLPYDPVTVPVAMAFAAVVCAGISFGEFKKGERTI